MAIEPVSDNVVVIPVDEDERTKGGVFLPETVRNKSKKGRVVKVGPGRQTEYGALVKPEVKVGQTVLYTAEWSGVEAYDDGTKYRVLRSSEIVAVVG
jgi:chaperonin GroES